MRRGRQWPLAIVAVLLLSSAGQVAFAVVASSDASFAVERDYYRKALRFDDELARRRASDLLAWRIDSHVQLADEGRQGRVTVTVTDSTGIPVAGASVSVVAMHNARAADELAATLVEVGAGVYEAPLPAERPGEWEVRITVARGEERFASSERITARQAR